MQLSRGERALLASIVAVQRGGQRFMPRRRAGNLAALRKRGALAAHIDGQRFCGFSLTPAGWQLARRAGL